MGSKQGIHGNKEIHNTGAIVCLTYLLDDVDKYNESIVNEREGSISQHEEGRHPHNTSKDQAKHQP